MSEQDQQTFASNFASGQQPASIDYASQLMMSQRMQPTFSNTMPQTPMHASQQGQMAEIYGTPISMMPMYAPTAGQGFTGPYSMHGASGSSTQAHGGMQAVGPSLIANTLINTRPGVTQATPAPAPASDTSSDLRFSVTEEQLKSYISNGIAQYINSQKPASPSPARTKRSRASKRTDPAILEHIHETVCGAIGAQYVGRQKPPIDIPDSPPEGTLRGGRSCQNRMAQRDEPQVEQIVRAHHSRPCPRQWEANTTLADLEVRLAQFDRGLALLTAKHGEEHLRGAEELRDVAFIDSEFTATDVSGSDHDSESDCSKDRELTVVKKEWVSSDVRRFILYTLHAAKNRSRASIKRVRNQTRTNPEYPSFDEDHVLSAPRVSYINKRWQKKNTYHAGVPDDPSHHFLALGKAGVFSEEDEAWLADDEDEEDPPENSPTPAQQLDG
ncbi:hypothetical protein BD626DRAFT_576646 [Schizophyllum amplum]|uniref:Uncharacterized protein n=1 Tax=Schizophyllum amplum TaxID=97359 RepID=A0A550BT97_9AGAR|nr:hypothetical protein BD626DRAFT_576646 [Auriculariopsis ampla]